LYWRRAAARGSLVVAFLLVLALLGGSSLVLWTRASIASTLQHNWRGSYDLLVLPASGSGAVLNGGYVEPNFAAYSRGGISLAQWRRIRALPGVAVAAPVAFLGQLQSPAYDVTLSWQGQAGHPLFCGRRPKAFELSYRARVSTGIRWQTIAAARGRFVLGCPDPKNPFAAPAGQVTSFSTLSTGTNAGEPDFDVSGAGVPQTGSPVVAVDPKSEMELTGASGSFLRPLQRFQRQVTTLADARALIPRRYAGARGNIQSAQQLGNDPAVLPLVVSDTAYAPIQVRASMSPVRIDLGPGAIKPHLISGVQVGVNLAPSAAKAVASAPLGPPTTERHDVSHLVIPFADSELTLPIPGVDGVEASTQQTNPDLTSSTVKAMRLSPRTGPYRGLSLQAKPQGSMIEYTSPTGRQVQEQTYRGYGRDSNSGRQQHFLWAPVGSYRPGSIDDNGAANYVPLGTYSATRTTVTSGADRGRELLPSLTGRGVVLPAPAAITTVASMHRVNPHATIGLIRVRAAGLGPYGPDARSKLEHLAAQIADLGLQVRVVAGSSLSPVHLYVPHYFAEPHGVSDLGWVEQDWTTMGAAVQVEHASAQGAWQLMVATLGGVSALAIAALLIDAIRRRRTATLLNSLGWRRTRVFRWLLAEDLPALVLVGAGSIAAALVAQERVEQIVCAAVAAVFVLATAGAAWFSSAPTPLTRKSRSHGRPVRGVWSASLRAAASTMSASVLLTVGLVAIGSVATLGVAVAHNLRAAAGTTRLASVATSRSVRPLETLVVVGVVAASAMLLVATRLAAARLRPQVRVLHAAAWSPRALRGYLAGAIGWCVIPGLAVSALALWWLGRTRPPGMTQVAQESGFAAILLATVVMAIGTMAVTVRNLEGRQS
jgi:hypothetical protein